MNAFAYHRPTTLEEAARLLSTPEARPLCGGTDLLVQMKDGRRRPQALVDIKAIPELQVLEFDEATGLRVGAAVPLADVCLFPPVRERYPAFHHGASIVGAIQTRQRAGLGGNLCNAAPSADTAPSLVCYNATVVIYGPAGRRETPLERFFVGPGQTVLGPGEILVEVRVPTPPARSGANYERHTPRVEMDIAVVGVGSYVELDEAGAIAACRIALGAVAPTVVRATAAEQAVIGQPAGEELYRRAGELAVGHARPISDQRGSAEFRRRLVENLVYRTLGRAVEAAQRR